MISKQSFSNILVVCICLLIYSENLAATSSVEPISIGAAFPQTVLRNIKYYHKQEVNTKTLKGKWLILDFWSRGCSYCVQKFPTMDLLQNRYSSNVQVFLIGLKDSRIQQMYDKFRKKDHLKVPILFDSVIFRKFKIHTVPFVIVIDPKGIIQAITYDLSEMDFISFLAGKTPSLPIALNQDQEEMANQYFDFNKPLFVNGNGGPDTAFYYRSLLGPWVPAMGSVMSEFSEITPRDELLQMVGIDLKGLYSIAYSDTLSRIPFKKINSYGKYWPWITLNMKDSSLFISSLVTGKNIFSYSQIEKGGLGTRGRIQARFQRDLESYFGFKVEIKTEMKPCWNLMIIADSLKNFHSRSEEAVKTENDLYDGSLQEFIASIWYHNQTKGLFYDKTGLNGQLRINLNVIMSNISEVNNGLKKYGLAFQPGEQEVQVIILSDR